MRLHTDKIEARQVYEATNGLPGVYAEVTEHGSRSRQRGLEVRLEGNGYRRNSGQHGADPDEVGATWDEWGAVIARLFAIDPEAFWGAVGRPTYRTPFDFHRKTAQRFAEGEMPADTHKRHTWRPGSEIREQQCATCSATRSFEF